MTKARETAALMLWFGIVLLTPPVILIFDKPLELLGVPLPVLYIFCVWLLLIAGSAILARTLPDSSE